MKSYLINLDRSTERLARMDKIFQGLALSYERVTAIDGKRLSQSERDRCIRRRKDGLVPLSASEIACFLSHRACLERVAGQQPGSFGAVFEDDVHLARDAPGFLSRQDWLPGDADIVKIETNGEPTLVSQIRAGGHSGRHLHRLRGKHLGAAGYIISQSCARRVLGLTTRFSDPIDELLFNPAFGLCGDLTVYQLIPALCVQDANLAHAPGRVNLSSEIEQDRLASRIRRTGLEKLGRELYRPLEKLLPMLSGTIGRPLTGDVRMRIAYEEDTPMEPA